MKFCMKSSGSSDDELIGAAQELSNPESEPYAKRRLFVGAIAHSLELGKLEFLDPGILAVDARGEILFCAPLTIDDHKKIDSNIAARGIDRRLVELEVEKELASVGPPKDEEEAIQAASAPNLRSNRTHYQVSDFEWVDLGQRILIPGFVDAHVHAPQYGYMGVGVGMPLLEWLDTYTFPFESQFKNLNFARSAYERAVRRYLINGTTFASYFATIHTEASKELVRIGRELGQRVHVGKVNMDQNGSEEHGYVETTKESLEQTEDFVDHVQRLEDPLAVPVITPRFVPNCSSGLMRDLASISDRDELPVQTHMSENRDEIKWVKELYPESSSYADVYDSHGLLNDRTYLAHCIHCTRGEVALLAQRGSAVVHCPNSNFALKSGVCDVRNMLNRGVRVALGTDVGGGTSPSMLNAIRLTLCASVAACEARNNRECETHDHSEGDGHTSEAVQEPITMEEAFYLATQGGADVLGKGDTVGNFLPGKSLDALIINGEGVGGRSPFDIFEGQGVSEIFQKFIFLGDDRNIEQIFVAGRRVV